MVTRAEVAIDYWVNAAPVYRNGDEDMAEAENKSNVTVLNQGKGVDLHGSKQREKYEDRHGGLTEKSGTYGKWSRKLWMYARDLGLNCMDLVIIEYIVDQSPDFKLKQKRISECIPVNEDVVSRKLNKMEDKGLVIIHRKWPLPNKYDFSPLWLQVSARAEALEPSDSESDMAD